MASVYAARKGKITLMRSARSQSGQELVQAAMIFPILVFILVMSCWVFLWQLGLHTTQFVAQEAARAATATSGLAPDPDAATNVGDIDDTNGTTDITFTTTQAKNAAQDAVDRSFLRGTPAGSPCPSGPPGQTPGGTPAICFVQKAPCVQGSGADPALCANQGVSQCIPNGASAQQAIWVCQWYEVPPTGSTAPYKIKIVVAGWYKIGLPALGGSLPVASIDEESIQRCRGCP